MTYTVCGQKRKEERKVGKKEIRRICDSQREGMRTKIFRILLRSKSVILEWNKTEENKENNPRKAKGKKERRTVRNSHRHTGTLRHGEMVCVSAWLCSDPHLTPPQPQFSRRAPQARPDLSASPDTHGFDTGVPDWLSAGQSGEQGACWELSGTVMSIWSPPPTHLKWAYTEKHIHAHSRSQLAWSESTSQCFVCLCFLHKTSL